MSPDLDQPGITFVDIAAIPAGPGGEATSASEASKRNALTHALTAKKVFPAELAAEIRECIRRTYLRVSAGAFLRAEDGGRDGPDTRLSSHAAAR